MPYPISDHYDGKNFFNPEPTQRGGGGKRRGGFFSVLRSRWRKDSGWATWPKRIENAPHPPPGPPPTVTFIGHSSFLLRLPGLTLLTDPVFSRRCSPSQWVGPKRVRDPGLRPDDLPNIDLILLSHNHYDHMDVRALRRIRRRFPHAAIVTTLGNAAFLARKGLHGAVELDWWQETALGHTTITATPARHFSARTLWDRNETLWAGFMLRTGGAKIYFAGDTGYTKFFADINARLGAPDLALLPIGAYEPRWFMGPVHMNPADAVMAFQDLQARRAVGMHYGTFQLTAEEIDAPQRDLAAALHAAGIERERFVALDIGESLDLAEVLVPA
ncbi:MBL fold metallo-hydrolase [Acidocella sp.]|uniref:MBL fold metallo-hydrolase n=1 Tax=Acidocella sp. TaxID=50710 RepID=UPI002F3EA836